MKKTIRRPADEFNPSPALLKRARALMSNYTYVIKSGTKGGYFGTTEEMPGLLVDGATLDQCLHNLSFGLETMIASSLADGEVVPGSEKREKRTEQINVRFTRAERSKLERESARKGFRGVGDLIRAEMIRQIEPKWR